jgi:hypothetical protein
VWPLIFQRLDSANPFFAGGLIVDTTLEEYLFYLGLNKQSEDGNTHPFPSGEPNLLEYVQKLLVLIQED